MFKCDKTLIFSTLNIIKTNDSWLARNAGMICSSSSVYKADICKLAVYFQ